jgi:hypothetical protein
MGDIVTISFNSSSLIELNLNVNWPLRKTQLPLWVGQGQKANLN